MTSPKGYNTTQIALHWVIAILVAAQYIFKDAIEEAWKAIEAGTDFAFNPLILAHVAGGSLILVLIVWRLIVRIRHGVPKAPENEPAFLKTLAHVAHWAFYLILAALSVTGLLAWFGGVFPAAQAHNILKVALMALVVLHVLAVPFHRIVLKNNVMQRMISPQSN